MSVLRPIRHEDRLSVIDHLDELRSRIIFCGVALLIVFGICFWQNQTLINVLNHPLPASASSGFGAVSKEDASLHHDFGQIAAGGAKLKAGLTRSSGVEPLAIQGVDQIVAAAKSAESILPKQPSKKLAAFGITEPFTTTLTVVGYFTLLFTLPLLIYQLYAFVIPALSRDERRVATPSMVAAPLLFMAGVVFTYFEVLPPAVHFLQGYNSKEFQIVIQARPYYKFEILLMLGIGLAFEVPLLLLALQKVGVITAKTLTLNWRYATVLITIIAAALPGVDPVTMFFETLPLVVLYLASIVLLKVVEYRTTKREAAAAAAAAAGGDADT